MSLTAAEETQTRELLAQQAAILALAAEEPAIISNLGATDVSLSDLTAATALNDADLMLVRQGTTDKSVNPLVLDGRYVKKSGDTMTGPLSGPNPATGNRSTLYATMQKFSDEFGSSLSSSGWQKLPNGLIIQWGRFLAPANSTTTITLPIAFPNAFSSALVTVNDNAATVSTYPFSTALLLNTSSFSLRSYYSQSSITNSWFAIGY